MRGAQLNLHNTIKWASFVFPFYLWGSREITCSKSWFKLKPRPELESLTRQIPSLRVPWKARLPQTEQGLPHPREKGLKQLLPTWDPATPQSQAGVPLPSRGPVEGSSWPQASGQNGAFSNGLGWSL